MSKRANGLLVAALGQTLGLFGCAMGSGDDGYSGASLGASAGGSYSNSAPGSASAGKSAGHASGGTNASSGGASGTAATPAPVAGVDSSSSGGTAGTAGDQYTDPGTNPFVLTEHDPLSTFGADVDTASYDIFRRDVNAGTLPNPASVRLEEYVNSFDYHYPPPAEDAPHPFSIHLAAAPSLYDTGTLLLRVGIQGKVAPAERGPANLVFLVDVSGSMASDDKLPLVKVVLNEALAALKPDDRVSIVTYAGSTSVPLQSTLVAEKDTIRTVIDALAAGGSTAGASGINLAYEQAESVLVDGGINHIVLCTDGDFNVGLTSDQALLDLIKEKRKTGITLTTLGFGSGNLNDSMMEKVSNAGNGMYSVISNADQAVLYAHDRLLKTMLHIAKDMKLQVEFNRALVLAYRLLGYEDRAIADDQFRDDAVDAGEVGVDHRVTALYELVPADGAVPAPDGAPALTDGAAYDGPVEVAANDLALVKVRYKQPGAAETDAAREVAAELTASAVADTRDELDADFRWAAAVATFAEILKGSPYARPDQLDTVRSIITADPDSNTGDKSEFRTLFDLARPRIQASK